MCAPPCLAFIVLAFVHARVEFDRLSYIPNYTASLDVYIHTKVRRGLASALFFRSSYRAPDFIRNDGFRSCVPHYPHVNLHAYCNRCRRFRECPTQPRPKPDTPFLWFWYIWKETKPPQSSLSLHQFSPVWLQNLLLTHVHIHRFLLSPRPLDLLGLSTVPPSLLSQNPIVSHMDLVEASFPFS